MIKIVLSEFFGTFMLVLIGTGAIIISEEYNGIIQNLGISIAFGGIVTSMILILGKISCHINPAVSIAFFLRKELNLIKLIPMLFAQVFGAIFASFLLQQIYSENINIGATLPKTSLLNTWLIEFFMSFILMFGILFSIHNSFFKKYIAFIVGFIVFLEAYFGGPLTGASMNPARSIGPALISGNSEHLWIYITAPILGMLSVSFYKLKRQ